jgi:hypothetical protein
VIEIEKDSMPRWYWKDAITIFVLLAFILGYFYQGSSWNENSRFDLIFAIVQEGRLAIDSFQNQPGMDTGDKAYFNGHYYSDKAVGPAVIGAILYAPMYWLGRNSNFLSLAFMKQLLTFLVVGIPSAIAGSLMFILCLYLSKSRARAYLVTLAVTLGTLYFPFSIVFFSHQLTSSLLFASFVLIFFVKEKPQFSKDWQSFLIGISLGWAFISEYPAIIIIIPMIIYYLYCLFRNRTANMFRSIILLITGGIIPVLIQLSYNRICFGNFLSIGYQHMSSNYFNTNMAKGLMGIGWPNLLNLYYMTLHPLMGIFWQSPVLLLFIIGAILMLFNGHYRVEAILVIWIISSFLVIMSGYYNWWGGYSLGPRFIIPILPFFCVLLIFIPKRFDWLLVILGLVSIGQMVIAAASQVHVPDEMVAKISTSSFFAYSNIYNYCLALLVSGDFAKNIGGKLLGLKSWYSLIPLFLVAIAISLLFFRREVKIFRKGILASSPGAK